jgi:hypothetical protein
MRRCAYANNAHPSRRHVGIDAPADLRAVCARAVSLVGRMDGIAARITGLVRCELNRHHIIARSGIELDSIAACTALRGMLEMLRADQQTIAAMIDKHAAAGVVTHSRRLDE